MGTAQTTANSALTIADKTVNSNERLVVLISRHNGTTTGSGGISVAHNGNALTLDVVDGSVDVFVYIYSYKPSSNTTGDIVLTNDGTDALAMAALKVRNLATVALDETASGTGTSSSPSSGATATTGTANEILVGAVATFEKLSQATATPGTWGSSFTNGQLEGTENGISFDAVISEGFKVVSSTGAYTASKTGITSQFWIAAIATYE